MFTRIYIYYRVILNLKGSFPSLFCVSLEFSRQCAQVPVHHDTRMFIITMQKWYTLPNLVNVLGGTIVQN